MVKLVYCLRRLPSLTLEEFQAYWFNHHGPLVRKHAATIRLRRYVQVHTMGDMAANAQLREERGGPEPYDGVAELWWESLEDLINGYSTPEGQLVTQELYEDEKKFMDHAQSPVWFAEERVILG